MGMHEAHLGNRGAVAVRPTFLTMLTAHARLHETLIVSVPNNVGNLTQYSCRENLEGSNGTPHIRGTTDNRPQSGARGATLGKRAGVGHTRAALLKANTQSDC